MVWRRPDILAGGAAGLIAGLLLSWTIQAGSMAAAAGGLLGVNATGAGVILHLLASILLGASFGLLFQAQRESYAAILSSGILYGLVWWIIGPLTLAPLVLGQGAGWSLEAAGALFPSLIRHLLFGGLVGLGYCALIDQPGLRNLAGFQVEPDSRPKKRIVILGGGFGGVSAAQHLEKLLAREPDVELTLVSHSNYLLFTPMLAEVASSALQPQHISTPIRAACPYTRFIRAEVEAIDLEAQEVGVRTRAGIPAETLAYDHLVLALGSVPNTYGLPGLAEHSFSLKSLEDATVLRNHVITLLERADVEPDAEERQRQLTFVVAGAGFAGTEMIAELFDLVHSVLRYYPTISPDELRFALVHSRDRILPELSAELADYARRKLQARGIDFVLEARVSGAAAGAVLLQDGGHIPTRTLVWTAGNQPHPLLQTLLCQRNRAGAIVTNTCLQVMAAGSEQPLSNVWALGDCAQIPDTDNEGQFHPPTAQHALRQGKTIAANVAASLRGRPLQPFRFHTLGLLVALGHRTGAAEIRGRRFSGLLAWFMWRTVYLGKLPGLEKKVRVALDWALDLLFPRDIVLTRDTPATSQPRVVDAPAQDDGRKTTDAVKVARASSVAQVGGGS